MKYRIEYESAKDGLVYTKDIEGSSPQQAQKALIEKYKAKPSKILSCRRIDNMKGKDADFEFLRKIREYSNDKLTKALKAIGVYRRFGEKYTWAEIDGKLSHPEKEKLLKTLMKDSIKKYKIGDKTIETNSPSHALKIYKMLDEKDASDFSYEVIKRQIDNPNFETKYLIEKSYNGMLRGDMTRAQYDELMKVLKKRHIKSDDSVKDDVDVEKYQMWVDYDMKHYHHISDDTMDKIKEAGLSIVKDQYGQYEVIAKDPVHDDDLGVLTREEEQAIEDYRKAIANTSDPKLLKVFAHILKEETDHLEELKTKEIEDEKIKDIPVGFEPNKQTKKIITWKNSIDAPTIKREVDRYKGANSSEKSILEKRIDNYINDLIEDYKHDLKSPNVTKAEVDSHYQGYNSAIKYVNQILKKNYPLF